MLPSFGGGSEQLSSLCGSPVVVSFFRLDCGESRRQIEKLQAASKKLGAAGVKLRAIALHGAANRPEMEALSRSAKLSFSVFLADERAETA